MIYSNTNVLYGKSAGLSDHFTLISTPTHNLDAPHSQLVLPPIYKYGFSNVDAGVGNDVGAGVGESVGECVGDIVGSNADYLQFTRTLIVSYII